MSRMYKLFFSFAAVALFMMKISDSGKMKRGIRNNNPGNLKITGINWDGKIPVTENTDGVFEQFETAHYGIRAMFKDIRGDIERDGLRTINLLIGEYAPNSENKTAAYVSAVSNSVGIDAHEQIKPEHYKALIEAIIYHENGEQPYSDETISNAMAAA